MAYCKMSDIAGFTTACDNMVASKYILVDKRLGDVLKSIASTNQVFNLISECMINFNFEKELTTATSKLGQFIVPEEPHKCIAFIFCLLNLLDDKRLNFNQFLNKYFSGDDEGAGPYSVFCQKIVLTFKNVIVSALVGTGEPVKKQETTVAPVEKKQIYHANAEIVDRLEFLLRDFKSFVHGLKVIKKSKCTRSELLEQLSAIIIATTSFQFEYIKALCIGIKCSIGKERELARRLVEIEDIIEKILDKKTTMSEDLNSKQIESGETNQ